MQSEYFKKGTRQLNYSYYDQKTPPPKVFYKTTPQLVYTKIQPKEKFVHLLLYKITKYCSSKGSLISDPKKDVRPLIKTKYLLIPF